MPDLSSSACRNTIRGLWGHIRNFGDKWTFTGPAKTWINVTPANLLTPVLCGFSLATHAPEQQACSFAMPLPVHRTHWRCLLSTAGASLCIWQVHWCQPAWCTSDKPASGRSRWSSQSQRHRSPGRQEQGNHDGNPGQRDAATEEDLTWDTVQYI